MSNPNPTSKPPSRLPPASKPRNPLPSSTPTSTTTRLSQIAPADRPLFHRRRSLLYAVGIGVVVSVGAVLGAQIKNLVQARDAANAQRIAQGGDGAETGVGEGGAAGLNVKEGGAGAAGAVVGPGKVVEKTKTMTDEERQSALGDVERSIKSLESRRGQLVTRRLQEEGRLRGLRQRMAERGTELQGKSGRDVRESERRKVGGVCVGAGVGEGG